jgi:HSP20 family protein
VPRDPRRSSELFLAAASTFQRPAWRPAVDVYETRDGWLLKYELAGVSPHEIQLLVRGRTVTLRGMRRDVRVDERRQSYCMEISYNQFERSLELPCELDEMQVITNYCDGMLFVRLSCQEPCA